MVSKWMWYPGDWEIFIGNLVMRRREHRGKPYQSGWGIDQPYSSVAFFKKISLQAAQRVTVRATGEVALRQGEEFFEIDENGGATLPEGTYQISITVCRTHGGLPAVHLAGETVASGEGWTVCHRMMGGERVAAAYGEFENPAQSPEDYRLPTRPMAAASVQQTAEGYFVDFGEETFGFLKLEGIHGSGHVKVLYGESAEEAHSASHCEMTDDFRLDGQTDYIHGKSRAMRYANILCDGVEINEISLMHEYLPLMRRGQFRCNDETINRVYEVAYHTFALCSRETFLDGIKRDRWYWSGDAYQSYLMNYYSFFDVPINRRTMWALRGKEPTDHHLNTITDYSCYWFIGLLDHYLYTGDVAFLRQVYPRALSLLAFCESRCRDHGFLEGAEGDWVFVDWADIEKDGALAVMQILFYQSYRAMAAISDALGLPSSEFCDKAERLKQTIMKVFWQDQAGAFAHSLADGKLVGTPTRHAAIFALLYGFLPNDERTRLIRSTIQNDAVPPIKTPYFKFYELAGLCEAGQQEAVTAQIRTYWGGMLALGATSFWEEYDPNASDHYSMYDRPFGKSLCHAWGAGPLFLLGRYYLGVRPAKPGYQAFEVRPQLGGLEWMEGTVPTPTGDIRVRMNQTTVWVHSDCVGEGVLIMDGKKYDIVQGVELEIERG